MVEPLPGQVKNMKTWIALFRGINVGGKNRLPMKPLAATLESAGLNNVRTYIQSGNVVFESSLRSARSLKQRIETAVAKHHGLELRVTVLTSDQWQQAISDNPWPEAAGEPKSLHVMFLEGRPVQSAIPALQERAADTERFQICDDRFYLHAPAGIGRSHLVRDLEKCLGVSGTSRNWRTVEQIAAMAADTKK